VEGVQSSTATTASYPPPTTRPPHLGGPETHWPQGSSGPRLVNSWQVSGRAGEEGGNQVTARQGGESRHTCWHSSGEATECTREEDEAQVRLLTRQGEEEEGEEEEEEEEEVEASTYRK